MRRLLLPGRKRGFTLVELLVSMAILTFLMLMMVSMTDATRRTWSYTNSKVEQFRGAREAFESISRKLSQATLNTYWDYDSPTAPTKYQRQSELRFISGNLNAITATTNYSNSPTHAVFFQAPLGYVTDTASYSNLENLLNTWGYFIEFGSDKLSRPAFINSMPSPPAERYRFRLIEVMEPSDSLTIYKYTSGKTIYAGGNSYTGAKWFTDPLSLPLPPAAPPNRPVRTLAENVVALVIVPKLSPSDQTAGGYTDASLAPSYRYDSTGAGMITVSDPNLNPMNQLPPVVQITMVALDEASFSRYQTGATMTDLCSGLFTDATQYEADLKTLQATLQTNKLNYRVFTTNVSIKAAKWSRAQQN